MCTQHFTKIGPVVSEDFGNKHRDEDDENIYIRFDMTEKVRNHKITRNEMNDKHFSLEINRLN